MGTGTRVILQGESGPHLWRFPIASLEAPGKMPPSSRMFCPVMKPACVEHRNAQVAPNSSACRSRRAGIVAMRCFGASSTVMPCFLAVISALERSRSVSNGPGSRKLMVTLCWATERATPARNAVRPARAPDDRSRPTSGIFTEPEVMLTMRPNFFLIIGSIARCMQLDRHDHVADDAIDHLLAVELAEIAERRAGVVGDQDVRLRAGGEQRVLALLVSRRRLRRR